MNGPIPVPPKEVVEFLREQPGFLILGHQEPDGDCVAAQLVLGSLLERAGKRVLLCSPGPFDRPEVAEFGERFCTDPVATEEPGAVVVLDCSTEERLGSFRQLVAGRPTLVMDHHAAGEPFGSVRWVDPSAPATSVMVQAVLERLHGAPTREEAELLLFGLCTDTGFFRHLGADSAAAFAAVARLVEAGASPREVYARMYGGQQYSRLKLITRTLERTERHFGGALLLTWQVLKDVRVAARSDEAREAPSPARGADEVYRLLQSVVGQQVIALIRQESDRHCSVGLRSGDEVDVGELARRMGGGGHTRAAGFELPGGVQEVRRRVLALFEPVLGAAGRPGEAAP